MNRFTDTLSDTVLSSKLEDCTLDQLETLAEKFPYASALQLLYARKLKTADPQAYGPQLQKTLLHYKNPLLITHLIDSEAGQPDAVEAAVPASPAVAIPDTAADHPAVTAPLAALPPEPPQGELPATEEHSVPETEAETEVLPPLPEFKIEAIDPAKADLSFTPYFTVDYFAAQGIKLGDQQANDKFCAQLKSFTAWLKQMKRLPATGEKTDFTDREAKTIALMAERSLSGQNADTEAMAEVWAKQGDRKKAIELYQKLSLQIPGKSAYFAAKIDHLKK